jgi:hypothetical protein
MAICKTKSVLIDGLSYETDFFELPKTNPDSPKGAFFELIYTRRAIRNFKDKPVPKALLEKITILLICFIYQDFVCRILQ